MAKRILNNYKFSHYSVHSLETNQSIMNKTIKTVLLIAGVVLLVYGIYNLIAPEASFDIGIIKAEAQDNTNAYMTIGFGILALAIGILAGKK